MRSGKVLAGVMAALALAVAGPAAAQVSQTVSGTVSGSVSMSASSGFAACDFGSFTVGQTKAVTCPGTFSVTANEAYNVTVVSNKPKMTAYANGTYDDTKTLENTLSVQGVPVLTGTGATVAVGTTAKVVASNDFTLVSGTITEGYSVRMSQLVTATDKLGSYRIALTYTAAAGTGV
jgi:hypothetical protein